MFHVGFMHNLTDSPKVYKLVNLLLINGKINFQHSAKQATFYTTVEIRIILKDRKTRIHSCQSILHLAFCVIFNVPRHCVLQQRSCLLKWKTKWLSLFCSFKPSNSTLSLWISMDLHIPLCVKSPHSMLVSTPLEKRSKFQVSGPTADLSRVVCFFLWQTGCMLVYEQDLLSVITTVRNASFCFYGFLVSLSLPLTPTYATHFQLVHVWKGTVWPAFPVLLFPASHKGTFFLFSFCRSIAAGVVWFISLDFSETLLTPHPTFFLATLYYFLWCSGFLCFFLP